MAEEGQHMDDQLYKAARDPNVVGIPAHLNTLQCLRLTHGGDNNILHVAARYGKQEFITSALAQVGRDHHFQLLCKQNSKGETPLHFAAKFGHIETVRVLLNSHVNAEAEIVPFIREKKPCWSVRDKEGDTPLHMALRYRHDDIALELLSNDIQLVSVDGHEGESLAYIAAYSRCNRFLSTIMDAERTGECSISFSGSFGQTVFHPARKLTADIMKRLIQLRRGSALLKTQDKNGKTVLHYAVEENRLDIVETLLRADSSLAYLPDNDGLTPLHRASKKGLFQMVMSILLYSPQSVEIRDNLGRTALHLAKMNSDILKRCLNDTSMKELINQVDKDGNTPLHSALINSQYGAAYVLLCVNGCNWRLKNKEGCSPLYLCRSSDKISQMSSVYIGLQDLEDGGEYRTSRYFTWRTMIKREIKILRAAALFNFQLEGMGDKEVDELLTKIGVVAVLLLGVSFSATFNVPGGYDKVTGYPILMNKHAYKVFRNSSEIAFVGTVLTLICCTFGHGKRLNKKLLARITILTAQMAIIATFVTFFYGTIAIYPEPPRPQETRLVIFVVIGILMYLIGLSHLLAAH